MNEQLKIKDETEKINPLRYRLTLTSCYRDSEGYLGINERVDFFMVDANRTGLYKIDSILLEQMFHDLKLLLEANDELKTGGDNDT